MMVEPQCETVDGRSFLFIHDCLRYEGKELVPDLGERRELPLELGGESPQAGWVWIGTPGDTIHPSIHCTRCGTHGFWRDRAWLKA